MSGDTPDCKTKKTPPKLTAQDYTAIVHRVGEQSHKFILDETKDLEPKMRWLVVGRIISGIFQSHYKLSFEAARQADKKKSEELE
jgi:hypothetical protein